MTHEAGKREQGDSFAATNGHPKTPSNSNGGSIAASEADEARSQDSEEINLGVDEYYVGSGGQPGNPSLRDAHYAPNTASGRDGESKLRAKEPAGPLEPPVTKATLAELDINKIIHSPKLRHDINFDPAVHFRPDLDGEKGRRKRQRASDFWSVMRKQLRAYVENREQFEKQIGGEDWTLPIILEAIGQILGPLVPLRDRAAVEDTLNVDLLMQQFRKGVVDLVKLATWLSQLITCHCAPMRDPLVDKMVAQISKGSQEGDIALLTSGIATLLEILEAMKLDVANHQIRSARPMLIEDTVNFEQKFFMRKIALGRIDITGAHTWFIQACSLPDVGSLDLMTPKLDNTWRFMKGLVNLTLPSKEAEMIPNSFLFDEERLIKLRADIEELVNLEICMQMYHELERASRRQRTWAIPYDSTLATCFVLSPDNSTLHSSPTLPSLHDFKSKGSPDSLQDSSKSIQSPPGGNGWAPNTENDSISLSSATSPRSSPSSAVSTSHNYFPTRLYLSNSAPDAASRLRSSLLAILDPSKASEGWTELAPSLALQILHSTTAPLSYLSGFESHLELHLSNPSSKIYQDVEQRVLLQILRILRRLIQTYNPLTCFQIYELAVVQRGPLWISSAQTFGCKDEITEIATKIAHIGILHWRVWSPLAYLIDPDGPAAQQDQPMT